MINAIAFYFTGLWPILWNYGLGFAAVAALLAFAWFSPVFKKTALWIALAVACCIAGYSTGIKNEADRAAAQRAAELAQEKQDGETILDRARRDAARDTPDSLRSHRWNRGQRKQ